MISHHNNQDDIYTGQQKWQFLRSALVMIMVTILMISTSDSDNSDDQQ